MFSIEHIAVPGQQQQGTSGLWLPWHCTETMAWCLTLLSSSSLGTALVQGMTNATFNFFNVALHSLYCNGDLYLSLNGDNLYWRDEEDSQARGTLGLATSHQLLACGSEVILPAGHHSPVQESTFNLNQLLQSVHHLLQHLLLSKISQRHQEEHEMWTPSCALQHNLYLAPFLWISSFPSSPSLLQANHYVKGCLKTSADGFSIAQSTSKTFNFHRPYDTGSIAPSAFHIQGKRGREHWHTQGKATKLNEAMGKTKPTLHPVIHVLAIVQAVGFFLCAELFPWRRLTCNTAAAASEGMEVVCRCMEQNTTGQGHVPCAWHSFAYPTGTRKANGTERALLHRD